MTEHDLRLHEPRRLLLSSADFEALVGTGALPDVGRLELVRGELIALNARYLPHALTQRRLSDLLIAQLESPITSFLVLTEPSVTVAADTTRQPDLAVIDFPLAVQGFVPASAVRLIVEVADTTLGRDTGDKLRDYARARIPLYWIVDLNSLSVRVCVEPDGETYAAQSIVRFGEPLSLAPLLDASITLPAEGFD